MGDDSLDFADLIAEEVGGALPEEKDEAIGGDHPLAEQLRGFKVALDQTKNAFEVLGLTSEASTEELRISYTAIVKDLHPDQYTEGGEELMALATDLFDKVRSAWDSIDTDEKRQKYIDHVILGKPTEEDEAMEQVRVYLDAESEFKKGMAAFNAGRIGAAHKLFASASDKVPDEIEFQVYLAYTTYSLNRTTDAEVAAGALENLKEVLDLNQQQERRLDGGWVLLGRAYREQGDSEAAKRCLVQALRFNPSNPDAPRELRRLEGGKPGGDFRKKKKGFFGKLFGKKKKK